MTKMAVLIGTILGLILGYGIVFGIVSLLIWLICWGFALTFSWKLCVGIFAVVILLSLIFKK